MRGPRAHTCGHPRRARLADLRPSPRALILSHGINTDLAHTASCSARGTRGPEWERKEAASHEGTSSGVTHVSCRQRGVQEGARSAHAAPGGSPPPQLPPQGPPSPSSLAQQSAVPAAAAPLRPRACPRGGVAGVVQGQAEQLREGRARLPTQAAGTQSGLQAAQHRGTSGRLGISW